MNQILAVENNKESNKNVNNLDVNEIKNNDIKKIKASNANKKSKIKRTNTGKPIEIKGIIKFFSIALIFFAIVFIGQGSYAIYKNVNDRKPANMPLILVKRINDRAIIYVEHNIEISKLIYSWNNGVETAVPIGGTSAEEEIVLVGYDSILNITIEDINGKRVMYKKDYKLTGVDITKPLIQIETKDGRDIMTIVAKDETEIEYLTYKWENEDPITINATENGQKEIQKVLELTKGTKEITVIAEDVNGNVEQITKTITVTSKPEIRLKRNGSTITIEVSDNDGIKDIKINLNGKILSKKDINRKNVKTKALELQVGNNTISVEVINVNDYAVRATKEITYNP